MINVEFRSGDLTISGQLYLPDPAQFTTPLPAVVVCHGIGSRKENQAGFDGYLAARGFAVLGFDFRGHGASQGSLDEHTLDDVQAALDFIATLPQVDPNRLALRGSSMGGLFALRAAAIDQRVRAVTAIAPAVPMYLAHGIESGFLLGLLERENMPVRVDVPSFAAAVRSLDPRSDITVISPRAVLLVQCKGDELVPFTWTEELFKCARDPKRVLMIEKGHHRFAQQDEKTHQATLEWFQTYV